MTPAEKGIELIVEAVKTHGVVAVSKMLARPKRVRDGRTGDFVERMVPYSHAAISLISRGKYQARLDRIGLHALTVLGGLTCPHDMEVITRDVCVRMSTDRPPIGNPLNLMRWQTCRSCPHRPKKGASK